MKAKKIDVKKLKKPLSKDAKKLIVVGVIFLVLFSIVFGLKTYTNSGFANSSDLRKLASFSLSVMPKSVEVETNGGPKEFFIEKSENFDAMFDKAYIEKTGQYDLQEINIYEALNFYYYDDQGKRVDLNNGEYNTATEHIVLMSYFGEELGNTFKIVDGIYTGFLVALVAGFIIYLIYVWYKAWSVKEDKRIAELKNLNAPKKKSKEEEQ